MVKKLAAPLISLLACEAELQYVALRNISFILQKQPTIFENNIKVFYCKFNDPVYVKLEKIEILVKVADKGNSDQILQELKEYSSDVDMELVGASVKAIGQIVLKVESSVRTAAACIQDIIKNGQTLALQDAVVVAKQIFRKFPNKYEGLIKELTKKIDEYYEVDAKAAIIWIVGEYAEKIDGSEKIIENFSKQFLEDPDAVKLQLITATVKLYLKKPEKSEELIQSVLKMATEEVENPDLRDRAYIYWRMLSTSPEKTAEVVLGDKPNISHQSYNTYEGEFVEELLAQISSICSIYHKTPEEMQKLYQISASSGMVSRASQNKIQLGAQMTATDRQASSKKEKVEKEEKPKQKKKPVTLDDSSEEEEKKETKEAPASSSNVESGAPQTVDLLGDLLGMDGGPPQVDNLAGLESVNFGGPSGQPSSMSQNQGTTDLLGDMMGASRPAPAQLVPTQSSDNVDFMAFGQDPGFPDQDGGADDAEAGWADGFGDDAADNSGKYDLNFARVELKEVLNLSTPGNKQKKAGLQVNAAINWNSEKN